MKRNRGIQLVIGGMCVVSMCMSGVPVFANENLQSTQTPPPVSIFLDIETASSTLFKQKITVEACTIASSTPTVSAYCAVQQSGVASTWSSYGEDRFLETLGGIGNDYANNLSWLWFSNNEYGQTSLNAHVLTVDEHVLITIGRMPLSLRAGTTTLPFGSTTTLSAFSFGFDSSWNGVWLPVSATIKGDDTNYEMTDAGTYEFTRATTSSMTLYASKLGYVDSPALFFPEVTAAALSQDPTPVQSSGGSSLPESRRTFSLSKAREFLESAQHGDGSFSSDITTDWAVLAFVALGDVQPMSALRSFLISHSGALSRITDYERRAMALMALGVDPYTGTLINYIQKIGDAYDGTQIGDSSLVNDDIFALFPLVKAGYADDQIVNSVTDFIVTKQLNDGSWEGSIDMTAAALQALVVKRERNGVSQAIEKGIAYLHSKQAADGGFGSTFSTSWVLQALSAMGETQSSWTVGTLNPKDYIGSMQETDGGIEPASRDAGTRVWATAYAVPGMLDKSWYSLMSSFSKPISQTVQTPNATSSIRDVAPAPAVATTTVDAPLVNPIPAKNIVATHIQENVTKKADVVVPTSLSTEYDEARLQAAAVFNPMLVKTAEQATATPGVGLVAKVSLAGLGIGVAIGTIYLRSRKP